MIFNSIDFNQLNIKYQIKQSSLFSPVLAQASRLCGVRIDFGHIAQFPFEPCFSGFEDDQDYCL